jgi:alginate O-acetyltransferase complex protein AlgI
MDLTQIAVFCFGALAYNFVLPARFRQWGLMIASILAIYWLQPNLSIPFLDFALPTVTIMITVMGWYLTRPIVDNDEDETRKISSLSRHDLITFGVITTVVLGVSATRYLAPELRLTSRPPDIWIVAIVLGVLAIVTWGAVRATGQHSRWLPIGMLAIVVIFVVTKSEFLATELSRFLRSTTGRDTSLASVIDVGWLGFSYVAFRIIHTLRDRQMGVLPDLDLREYLTYVIFFPSFTAGPIDRAERFINDFRALPDIKGIDSERIVTGSARIAVGMFKKFVIADTLAIVALNITNANQAVSTPALWILLYGYAFRLFFDFSGYSDIAIGVGLLFGIQLPENFNRPYLKNNIQAFWQSWHISLSHWVRFYIFSPLSRNLLRRKPKPPIWLIMLICHMSTMIVIGLWHGITIPFFIWGAWHGVGLFTHKMWTDRTRKWYISLKDKPRTKQAWTITGAILTFHFVVLGWVWFALPDINTAFSVFIRLFGIGS